MIKTIHTLIKREMKLSLSKYSIILSYSSFFILSLLIFTFGVGPEINKNSFIYEAVIWVIMLFSIILISENFLLNDFLDGGVKELQYLGYSEELIIFSKTLVMYLILLIPQIFLIPISAIFFNIEIISLIILSLNIMIGMPSLILISVISTLLTIQIKMNKVIQFVIILPFYVPLIIFTTSNNQDISLSMFELNKFLILIGFFLITLPLTLIIGKLILNEVNK